MKTAPLADVRSQLSRFIDEVESTHERVTITRNGRPAAVLISPEDLDSLQETLFWLAEPSIHDEGDGELVTVDAVRAELVAKAEAEGQLDVAARLRGR